MLKKNLFAAAFFLGAALFTAQASAQAYLGGSIGRAKWGIDCAGATSCHTSAGSAKIFGGYDYNPYFGVEGSYIYLNEVSANDDVLKGAFNGRGMDIAAVGKLSPMKGFTGFAKLGVAYMKGEVIASAGNFGASDKNYSAQPLIGLGATYQLDAKMSVRLELDRRRVKVSGFADSTSSVTNFSVGIQSEF